MSKANIERMLPKAIEVLEAQFGQDTIESVYQGYISSFGIGIVQVGLLPTLAYFESETNDENGQNIGDKKIISNLVRDTLEITDDISLLTYAIKEKVVKEEIKDASVALKLGMRLFDLGNRGVS